MKHFILAIVALVSIQVFGQGLDTEGNFICEAPFVCLGGSNVNGSVLIRDVKIDLGHGTLVEISGDSPSADALAICKALGFKDGRGLLGKTATDEMVAVLDTDGRLAGIEHHKVLDLVKEPQAIKSVICLYN